MGHLTRAYRASRGEDRSALPRYERWEVAPCEEDGVFTIGRALGMRELLTWRPLDGQHPHELISGSTGGGKTSLLAMHACLPSLWNRELGALWGRTLILDPKGGAGYDAAVDLGAEVVTDLGDIRDALRWAYEESERRNRLMGRLQMDIPDDTGFMREGNPKKLTEVSLDQRERHDMHPTLLVIDELADVVGAKDKGEPITATQAAARRHLKELAQKARAAGVVGAFGIVRPDAAILDGFTRAQIQARIAVGAMDDAGYTMMLGRAEGEVAAKENESMDPGQAWVVGLGGLKVATRVYIGHTDLSQYRNLALDPRLPVEDRAEIIAEREARRVFVQEDAGEDEAAATLDVDFPADLRQASIDVIARAAWHWLDQHGPATRREVADGINANKRTLENLLATSAEEPYRAWFEEAGRKGPAGVWRAAGPPPRAKAPRRGVWSRGVRGVRREAPDGGRWRAVRAWVLGPWVRLGLRVYALRLLVGSVAPGEHYRDPRVVWRKQDAAGGRCELCGRAGQINVHHVRPVWAGGADDDGNVKALCQRTAASSCHGASTAMERRVRDFRRRIGTYRDAGEAPTPLTEVVARVVGIPKPFTWVFAGAALAGLVYTRPLWLAVDVVVLVVLGPLWAWWRARQARKHRLPHPTRGVRHQEDRQVAIETFRAKVNPRRWWDAWTLRHHRRVDRRRSARIYSIRIFGWHLIGATFTTLAPLVPLVLWTVVAFLV